MTTAVYEVVKVLSDLKYRVTGAAVHRDSLYVGGADGALRVYQVVDATAIDPVYRIVSTLPKFSKSKSAITDIEVMPAWDALFSISDAHVTMHRLSDQALLAQLPKTKGCGSYAVSAELAMLCAAVKNKVLVFTWVANRLSLSREHVLPEVVTSLSFAGYSVCLSVGSKDYRLLDPLSGHSLCEVNVPAEAERCRLLGELAGDLSDDDGALAARPAHSPDTARPTSDPSSSGAEASSLPMASAVVSQGAIFDTPASNRRPSVSSDDSGRYSREAPTSGFGSELVLSIPQTHTGLFVDFEGNNTRTATRIVQFEAAPSQLATSPSYPYLLSRQASCIEVHSTRTTGLSQRIPIPGALGLAFCRDEFQLRASEQLRREASSNAADSGDPDPQHQSLAVLSQSLSAGGHPSMVGGQGLASTGSIAAVSVDEGKADSDQKESSEESEWAKACLSQPETVYAVLPGGILMLRMVPVVMQVAALLSRRPPEFEEALALCEQAEDSVSEAKIQQIRAHFGYELFAKGEYASSLGHLLRSGARVRKTLSLYPMLLPRGVSLPRRFPVAMPVMLETDLPAAVPPLLAYLLKQRRKLKCNTGEVLVDESESSDDEYVGRPGDSPTLVSPADGLHLPAPVLVDTVLLAAYLWMEEHERQQLLVFEETSSRFSSRASHRSAHSDTYVADGRPRDRSGSAASASQSTPDFASLAGSDGTGLTIGPHPARTGVPEHIPSHEDECISTRMDDSSRPSRRYGPEASPLSADDGNPQFDLEGCADSDAAGEVERPPRERKSLEAIRHFSSALRRLVSGPNCCFVEHCELQLRARGKYEELVLLYKGRGLHQRALELLSSQLELALRSGSDLAPALGALADYLQGLGAPYADLVFEFTRPLLAGLAGAEGANKVMGIFTSRPRGNVEPIDPAKVLAFLRSGTAGNPLQTGSATTSSESSVWDGHSTAVRYLEFVVNELQDTVPERHNELALLYLESIFKAVGRTIDLDQHGVSSSEHIHGPRMESGSRSDARSMQASGMSASRSAAGGASGSSRSPASSMPSAVAFLAAYPRAEDHPGPVGRRRRRLAKFLQSSTHYQAETLLPKFPGDCLFEERAVLLGRVRKHGETLGIYVHQLRDHGMAESYCERVYADSGDHGVFTALLQAYLSESPPELRTPMRILVRHASCVNPEDILPLLPDDAPLSAVSEFVSAVLRHVSNTRRALQVTAPLLKVERLESRIQLSQLEARRTRIDFDTRCGVCRGRIGGAAFCVYPNDVLIHQTCMTDESVCPVTGSCFRVGRKPRIKGVSVPPAASRAEPSLESQGEVGPGFSRILVEPSAAAAAVAASRRRVDGLPSAPSVASDGPSGTPRNVRNDLGQSSTAAEVHKGPEMTAAGAGGPASEPHDNPAGGPGSNAHHRGDVSNRHRSTALGSRRKTTSRYSMPSLTSQAGVARRASGTTKASTHGRRKDRSDPVRPSATSRR